MAKSNKSLETEVVAAKDLETSTGEGSVLEGLSTEETSTGGDTVLERLNAEETVNATIKAEETVVAQPNTQQIPKPKPMTHIDEFLLTSCLRPEQKAGFRVYAGKLYNTEKGWKDRLTEYENRQYRGGATK